MSHKLALNTRTLEQRIEVKATTDEAHQAHAFLMGSRRMQKLINDLQHNHTQL
jgi:predicted RNA-binding protein with PIN domain